MGTGGSSAAPPPLLPVPQLSCALWILHLTTELFPSRLQHPQPRLTALSSGEERNSRVLHGSPVSTRPLPRPCVPIHSQNWRGGPSSSTNLFPSLRQPAPGPLPRSEHHRPLGLNASLPLIPAPWAYHRRCPKTVAFLSPLWASLH